jgi:hypothetical protein
MVNKKLLVSSYRPEDEAKYPSLKNLQNKWNLSSNAWIVQIIAVMALICLKELLHDNMSMSNNDLDVLPLAKQYVYPNWIPGDWYLNQPPGYRLLFQALMGRLIGSWGFLSSSIAGRLFCYSLMAWGLVIIGRKLGLSLPLQLLAVGLFLKQQTIAAGEGIVGGVEAKAFSYAFLLLAMGLMLSRRYRLMAFLLGLATSFHVLVGGYMTLFLTGWLIFRRKTHFPNIRELVFMIPLYLLGSAFGLKAVVEQLFTLNPTGSLLPSYIYVFLRLPHHLNPLSWSSHWWIVPIFFLIILISSVAIIWFNRPSGELPEQDIARKGLFELTLISLVPFLIGLIVAPFDSQGRFLQYYPFRVGDVLLPLSTWLLFACALQQIFISRQKQRVLLLISSLAVSVIFVMGLHDFQKDFQSLLHFPNEVQNVDPLWKDMTSWVRINTPKQSIFISSPVGFTNFSWLTERPTIAKYKFMAQSKAGILEWYGRMRDLSGDFNRVNSLSSFKPELLSNGYNNLTTDQAKELMIKYQASYLVTRIQHQLNLPVSYRNQSYILYKM